MFRNLLHNLTRNQKIAVFAVAQILVIVVLAVCLNVALNPQEKIKVVSNDGWNMAEDRWQGIKRELWNLMKENIEGMATDNIDDVVIRDGTYRESTENDITTATFLVDIDSLRQTYQITAAWSDKVELYDSLAIDCPPVDQMKYPDTVCKGMFNTTASLDLYLPHDITDDDTEDGVLWAYIYGDEYNRTIDVEMAPCDIDATRKKVDDYLGSLPIDMDEYTVNYLLLKSDVDCEYKTTLMEEYYDGEE